MATVGTQDLVFIGSTDGYLYCFNASAPSVTGPLWKESLDESIFTSPIVIAEGSSSVVLCASHSGSLYAFSFDATSHTRLWTTHISNNFLFSSPAYDWVNDLVFEPSYDGNLYAVHVSGPQAGQVAWARPVTPTRSTPAVTNGYVYNLSNSGVLTSFAKSNGTLRASMSIGSTAVSSPAAFRRGTTDTIVTCGENGAVQEWSILDNAGNFVPVWKNLLPAPIYSSPAVSSTNISNPSNGGIVCVGCHDGKLYALDLTNGHTLSSIAMGKTVQLRRRRGKSFHFFQQRKFTSLCCRATVAPYCYVTAIGTGRQIINEYDVVGFQNHIYASNELGWIDVLDDQLNYIQQWATLERIWAI